MAESTPANQAIRLSGVLVVGKGVHRVNRKDQLSYECRISEIDDNTIFHISCNNFTVETAPSTPFEDKIGPSTPAQPPSEAPKPR
jgi:hypothetical protein